MDILNSLGTATMAVGHDGNTAHPYGAISPPIIQTAQFRIGDAEGQPPSFTYTRLGNPTVCELEQRMARLEQGSEGVAFASGMAAIAAMIAVAKQDGSSVYLMTGSYAGTARLLRSEAAAGGLSWEWLHPDIQRWPEQVKRPAIIWLESPSNPLLTVIDIAEVRQQMGEEVQIVVDNTLATPVLQRPLLHGADAVIHSASKFLGGHSDVIAGIAVVRNPDTAAMMRAYRTTYGGCLDPFAAWLVLRGIQTLPIRMAFASASANLLASELSRHTCVSELMYPGFRPHVQMQGGGAVVTLRLSPALDPQRFMASLKIVTVAESLGGVETLCNHSVSMSHSSLPDEEKMTMGLDDRVFRLSIGLEETQDLLADIIRALDMARL